LVIGKLVLTDEYAGHTPVLPEEVIRLLDVQPRDIVVDATVGVGGHARLLAERLGQDGMLIGLDVDPENLERAQANLTNLPCRVELVQSNFAELPAVLNALKTPNVDVLLADLGVSSTQLDRPERGFSFRTNGPLDMRMDPRLTTTAADLVNGLKDRELSDVLFYNAQETASRRIARRICAERREGRITTTARLATIICEALGVDPLSRRSKIHPATRSFQALRMAVNDEIPNLQALLDAAPNLLSLGGRFGVIAFHSVEDKPVKVSFRANKQAGTYRLLTPKPLVAEQSERDRNPRSRSAKLRVAVRWKEDDKLALN
jgi:16S rRNA (cytosine1402-N4)-methyltransferase